MMDIQDNQQQLINYTGTTPTYIDSVSLYGSNNAINSCRLYYLNDSTEITNVLIS